MSKGLKAPACAHVRILTSILSDIGALPHLPRFVENGLDDSSIALLRKLSPETISENYGMAPTLAVAFIEKCLAVTAASCAGVCDNTFACDGVQLWRLGQQVAVLASLQVPRAKRHLFLNLFLLWNFAQKLSSCCP
jgi:hypothetical protein